MNQEFLFTEDLQNRIDECALTGVNVVFVPAGVYRIGTLFLRSNVRIHLEKGAVLLGCGDLNAYPLPEKFFRDAIGQDRGRALILGIGVSHISITGEGMIDGNGGAFPSDSPDHAKRPFLVRLVDCRDVLLEDVSLCHSAAWTCHLQNCEEVRIRKIRIDSRLNGNNDGIDIDSCRHVRVADCDIVTGDDAVCLKSTLSSPCEDVEVSGCTLSSDCGALKIGTESYGDIRRIHIHDCHIRHAGLGAIKILSSDGGLFEDIVIRNVKADETAGPIFIRLGERGNTYEPDAAPKKAGGIRRVTMEQITARVSIPENGVSIYPSNETRPGRILSALWMTGLPDREISEIHLSDLDISFAGGGLPEDCSSVPELAPARYPELHHFGIVPSSCIYICNARGVKLENIHADLQNADARPGIVTKNVIDLTTNKIYLPNNQEVLSSC